MKITDAPAMCAKCGWKGTVWECEPDIDGDGNLGCPDCNAIVYVQMDIEDYIKRNKLNNKLTMRKFGFGE